MSVCLCVCVCVCVCVEVAINNMATVQTGYALRVGVPNRHLINGPTSGLMEGNKLTLNAFYCSSYDGSNSFCNKLGALFKFFLFFLCTFI